MDIIRQKRDYSIPSDYFFFDIETTDLSPKSSYVYLIGYLQMEGNECILTSVFCDDYNEEKELLKYFIDHFDRSKTLVHFNGSTFDIPYLNYKFNRYRLNYTLEAAKSLDILKCLRPHKKYFDCPDLKLKTVEKMAGYDRTDTFSGKELATVYEEMTGMRRLFTMTQNPDVGEKIKALKSVMLLHNAEDLDGLYCVYSKCGFLSEPHDLTFEMTPYQLIINIPYPLFPVSFEADTGLYYIICSEKATEIAVTLRTGDLHYYFDNYKDYTYVISEGYAMLTSVTTGIPKDDKKKATRETAYTRKSGIFLPVSRAYTEYALGQHIYLFGDTFKTGHSYVEFRNDLSFLMNYVKYLMR